MNVQIVTGVEMRSLEKQVLESFVFSPLILIENAGSRIVETLKQEYGCLIDKKVHILVGTGNNGGDGLVVARQLLALKAKPKVYLVGDQHKLTPENKRNLEFLRALDLDCVQVKSGQVGRLKFSLRMADLVVDALLGTGFSGELAPDLKVVVEVVNELQRPVVAVDVPTGVDAATGEVFSEAVQADLTINLGFLKLGCLLYPGKAHAGKNIVVDLGFPLQFESGSRYYLQDKCLNWLPKRDATGHKGSFGHVLVVAGSSKYAGAAKLAGQAALRGGSGLVTLGVPQSLLHRLPADELMVQALPENEGGSLGLVSLPLLEALLDDKDVLVLGPGLSADLEVTLLVQNLLSQWSKPAVIDADALLALDEQFLTSISYEQRKQWILTPHPGEMARLSQSDAKNVNAKRVEVAEKFAETWGVVLVLKGAPTIIANSKKTYLNSSGNPSLATAGTGDVLAGLIGALLAQGMEPLKAAASAVYAHGKAGDLLGAKGQMGLIASDCLQKLPEILV